MFSYLIRPSARLAGEVFSTPVLGRSHPSVGMTVRSFLRSCRERLKAHKPLLALAARSPRSSLRLLGDSRLFLK